MKIAPHSVEAEQYMITSCLIDNEVLNETKLEPHHFYTQKHRLIWKALHEVHRENGQFDVTTVIEHMRVNKTLTPAGGINYLLGLLEGEGSGAFWVSYEETLLGHYHRREIIRHAEKARGKAFELGEPDEILGELESFLTTTKLSKEFNLDLAIESAARYATGEALVKTGFPTMDNAFGGFTRNDLTIVGARNSTGKSAWAHAVANNIAQIEGGPVLIFTPDQPIPEILALQAAREARTPLALFRHGKAQDQHKQAYLEALKGLKDGFLKRVEFRPGILTLESFELEVVRAVRRGVKAIMVDTVNRFQAKGDKMHTTLAEFGTIAKGLAAEYDVPIIALAQLRRELDFEDRAPTKADLADAPGALANDANMILLLHRGKGADKSSIMDVIISKAKADEAGGRTIQLFFDAQYATVREF